MDDTEDSKCQKCCPVTQIHAQGRLQQNYKYVYNKLSSVAMSIWKSLT